MRLVEVTSDFLTGDHANGQDQLRQDPWWASGERWQERLPRSARIRIQRVA